MTVHDVINSLWHLAPEHLREDWDNVGLMVGRGDADVSLVLVALDATETVAEEAERLGCELVVTHHPLIFHGVKSVTDEAADGRRILAFLERGIAVISMHTNLDCAPGGVNDVLAAALGLHNISILDDEETAGLVRMGEAPVQALPEFAGFVKTKLNCPGIRYADGGKQVCHVAVGGGACGDYIERVAAAGCDTFVTADLKYHQFADAKTIGINLIDAGHFETEDPVCAALVSYLQSEFPALHVQKSAVHADCICYL